MSFKTKVLVLKRIKAGDQDLLAKVYGYGGVMSLLLRDGFEVGHRFFGVFEPFNVVEVDLVQRGDIVLPNDVSRVDSFSMIASNFNRYLWMCWVANFILRRVRFYEEKLFNLFIYYITRDVRGRGELYKLRLKLDFLKLSGLNPKFLSIDSFPSHSEIKVSDGSLSKGGEVKVRGSTLRLLKRIHSGGLRGVSAFGQSVREAHYLLDALIEFHTK